jgi:3'-5' exoribonuclease
MIWIKDYQDGNHIGETLLVTQVNKGTTTSNATFLTLTLQDKTGSIEGKIWDIKQGMEQMIQPGVFLLVQGDVISYRNALQVKIDQVKLMNADSLDVSDFTMVAPIALSTMEETLKEHSILTPIDLQSKKASFSKRIVASESQIDVGASDKYIAVCRKHF